jgi:Ca2+-binding RTX toxin-like protein
MATLTVPGAGGTTVTNTFTGAANTALAQSIADTLNGLLATGGLTVASVIGGGSAPPASGNATNELQIVSGGVVSVPSGYAYVVDGTQGGNLTVAGGNSFFGGNGNISYTNSGTGAASIVAGNGSDTFNLSGTYTVAAGSGFDRYGLSGTGDVSLGGGSSLVSITGGADTIFAGSNPGDTGITGGSGSVFFYAGASATRQVLDVVVGGSGGDTIVGANNNVVFYISPTIGGASAPGALLVAGGGNETLFGANSHTNDSLWGSFTGGNDLLWAGSGNDALVAGSGNSSLVGGSGSDTFYVINSNLLSTLTHTTVTPGKDMIFGAHSGDTLALTGFDTLYGAAGSHGAATVVTAALSGGASAVTLKDGTTITFVGGTNGINVISS